MIGIFDDLVSTEFGANSVEVGVAGTIELTTLPTNNITDTFSNVNGKVNW
ncbi:hypothetical protein [Lentilactobacillus kosonis]|nr:hypothetical protein [Lentilactobacillus kosonis]